MNGEDPEAAYASAAAAVAAAVASLPDQSGQHQLTQAQLLALRGQADRDQDLDQDGYGQGDGQQLSRKPRKLRKPSDVARCQVDGCGRDLSDAKLYLRRYSVCDAHFKAEWVMLSGGRFRFCQQCNKFQPLDNFSGARRSCKARSEDRNLRRRKQRTDERAAAGDDNELTGAGRLKGPPNLCGLTVPSRATLGDNGMLRQLGGDPSDPSSQLSPLQYASQVQQLLLANGNGGGLPGLAPGGLVAQAAGGSGVQVQMPGGMDLAAAAAALVGGDLLVQGGASPNANALSLLSAAAAANGAGRGGSSALSSLADPSVGASVGGNVLHQLHLAQLASALSKGGAIGANGGMPGGVSNSGAGGLASALGNMGMGLNGGGLGGSLNSNVLTQQLLVQQAAAAAGSGLGSAGGGQGGLGQLSDGSGLSGGLDLQSLMAQQLLQQTSTAGQTQPVLVLHNQNVMLLSLDPLGLLQHQAK